MELKGKIINFLGDSITEGIGLDDVKDCYDRVVKRKCDTGEIRNYSISGSRFAHQSAPSYKPHYDLCFCGRAFYMDRNADIIVVYGGVNDYIHGDAPIGTPEDTTPSTFYGALDFLMNFLKENFTAEIVFMTPAHCLYRDIIDTEPSHRVMKRDDAMPLCGYVDIIKEKAAQYGIHVADLFNDLGIDPKNEDECEKYMGDGLHFNPLGHEKIADLLIDTLQKI